MKTLKLLLILSATIITNLAFSQTATIDFSTIPYNPNFFDNGGCPTYHRFGPYPIKVNEYNVRTVGTTQYRWSIPKYLSLYAGRNDKDPSIENKDP